MKVGGNVDKVREAMIKAMIDVWPEIGDQLMYDFIDSIITRVNVVLEAEGWYIRF